MGFLVHVRLLDCIVATICDMGANIVKALKLFGATRQKVQNQDAVTIYDASHLKCTRNLFLKYKVQF
jgi:hypothetical protein